MYSERYTKEVLDLKEWFKENLKDFPNLVMTMEEYSIGTDSLKDGYKAIVSYVFWKWLYEKHYGLSYSQGCSAFFSAVDELGKFKIEG
jgi:hypothetical protein